jgi:hypothetical protein
MSNVHAGTSGGVVSDNLYEAMALFDNLPKPIRKVLQDAHGNFSTRDVVKAIIPLARKGMSGEEVAKLLAQQIAWQLRFDVKAAWGDKHPQAE